MFVYYFRCLQAYISVCFIFFWSPVIPLSVMVLRHNMRGVKAFALKAYVPHRCPPAFLKAWTERLIGDSDLAVSVDVCVLWTGKLSVYNWLYHLFVGWISGFESVYRICIHNAKHDCSMSSARGHMELNVLSSKEIKVSSMTYLHF